MKRFFFLLAFCVSVAVCAQAQSLGLTVREVDGVPTGTGIRELIVTNGTLTISGQRATISTGGGGGGGTPGGSNGNVQFNSVGSFGGVAGFNFNGTSAITLGVAGTSVGSIGFRNVTSGTITVQPVTGALGTVTLSLPARTATVATTTGTLTSGRLAEFDASGNLIQSAITATTLSPAGVANSIQVNNGGGLFDGGANAVLDLLTSTLSLGTNSSQSGKLLLRNATNANTTTIQPGAPSSALTFTLPATLPASAGCLEVNSSGVITQTGSECGSGGGGANTALSNLASVAINTTLVSDTDNTDDLGTSAIRWKNLYLAGFVGDGSGNELLKFSATASAVNEFTIANAATGGHPALSVTGGDTNINLRLTPKGTGAVSLSDGTATNPGLMFASDTDDGWSRGASDGWVYSYGGASKFYLVNNDMRGGSNFQYGWTNGTVTGSFDTHMVRAAGAAIRFGNGGSGAGSLILGTSAGAIGTSGAGVLAFTLSTEPSTSPTDTAQLYSKDFAAGDHRVYLRNEASSAGSPVANLGDAQTWTGIQTYGSGLLRSTSQRVTTGINDANGNSMLAFSPTASAVNYFQFTNSATATKPTNILSVEGSDASLGLHIKVKNSAGDYPNSGQVFFNTSTRYDRPSISFYDNSSASYKPDYGIGLKHGGSWLSLNAPNIKLGTEDGSDLVEMSATARFTWSGGTGGGEDCPPCGDLGLERASKYVIGLIGAPLTPNNTFPNGATWRAIPNAPAQITADQNNYDPVFPSYTQTWNTDASRNITGMAFSGAAAVSGQVHKIWNNGSFNFVIIHQSASSTAANRFLNSTGGDITVVPNDCVDAQYETGSTNRWRITPCTSSTAGTGTVTSVSFTGGLISVATATTTPALTVAGTSGGIPYFSSASTWASSGALTANMPVIGGGAGVAPSVGTVSGNTTKFVTTTGTLTSGNCAQWDANGNLVQSSGSCGSGSSSITIGTTTVSSGTDTRILYNNAGVVGEYPITGTTNVVMSASPTLTGTVAMASATASGTIVQTSASATAFESGPNGSTNPVFRLVNNTASAANGISITGKAAGTPVTITVISSGTNEGVDIVPKGLGAVRFVLSGSNVLQVRTGDVLVGSGFPLIGGSNNSTDLGTTSAVWRTLYLGTNLFLGPTTAGTSAAKTFIIGGSTAPSTSPADQVQMYALDATAGAHELYTRNEAGEIERQTGLAARNSSAFTATSNTTLTNITGLTRNVEAGRTYAFTVVLQTTAPATGGIKAAISGTATATAISYEGVLVDTAAFVTQTRATALDTTVCASTTSTAGTCTIRGVIQVNAAGTLTVQFAQNASDGSASTVLANQYFQLIPIS